MTSSSAPRRQALLTRLLAPGRLPAPALALLWLAAAGVAVAGYLHGHLFHEGYAHVSVVGPLFALNVIGSGVVVAALLLRRYAIFAAGALSISLGAVVSILISHTTSFFGFAEHAYGWRATTIVIAEIVAAVSVLTAAALARGRLLPAAPATSPPRLGGPFACTAALLVLVATALVAVGFGQGSPPPQHPLSATVQAHEIAALARARGSIARGRSLFASDGCSDCHALAAGGFDGQLGPRLDTSYLPAAAVRAIIADPPHEIPGFQRDLMPRNFAQRLPDAQIRDIAAFVAAASRAAR